MDIFYGADGSGDSDNATYKATFSDSFVRRFYSSSTFQRRGYNRGPGMMGSETVAILNQGSAYVLDQIASMDRNKTPYRLFLAGYSRGGAIVTKLAFDLKAKGIKVQALLLFDAVDMSNLVDAHVDVVPSNVKYCFHAMRDPNAGSREVFGNCATGAAAGVIFRKKTFHCTHGAMGGTPWPQGKKAGGDKIEEMSNTEKVGGMAGASMVPIVGPLIGREIHKNDYTNVTYDQEKAAGPAIWKWMNENLSIAQQDVATS